MKYSVTIIGIVVMVAGTFLMDLGFSEGCTGEITAKIPLLVGAIGAWYGRYRQGDITPLGFKK